MLNPLEDPTYLLMSDGSLLASGFSGLRRAESSLCAFEVPDPDVSFAIVDVARNPTDPSQVFAPTSAGGGIANRLFRSDNEGVSWEPTSAPIEPILFETLLVASDEVLYLSGIYPRTSERPAPEPFIHRSADGGATWERFAFEPWTDQDRTLHLLVVDPGDPQHLFARVIPKVEVDRAELLVESDDGGQAWTVVAEHREIGGMVYAPGGTLFLGTEWVAMPNDPTAPAESYPHGLYRRDSTASLFTQVRDDIDVKCLGWRDGSLWACGDNYRDGFMIGESSDEGLTFEARLVLADMAGPVECEPGSSTTVACESRDRDVLCDFQVVSEEGSLLCDGAVSMRDGGTDSGSGGGCACRTGGEGGVLPYLFVVLILAIRRRTA
ncbi:MAG: exo-alpha-sialidase [Deltaproteobacteria bacterium]|nr:exo-alpha-sialidase [Deltaproteobacteria bacterium]